MFIFDMTNTLTLLLILAATILFIFLSQEIKKSAVAAIPLFGFLLSLVVHTIQLLTLKQEFSYLYNVLCLNVAIDFTFLLITFLAYLWADEVESRTFNKKRIKDGLDWLWKKL